LDDAALSQQGQMVLRRPGAMVCHETHQRSPIWLQPLRKFGRLIDTNLDVLGDDLADYFLDFSVGRKRILLVIGDLALDLLAGLAKRRNII
jgi:hypothetical protein